MWRPSPKNSNSSRGAMPAYTMKPAASRGTSKGRSLRANISAPGGFAANLPREFRVPARESQARGEMARQKEVDQEKALRNAVRLFSQQGFAATSTGELMGVMNVGRQSRYDTFVNNPPPPLNPLPSHCHNS